jgi:alpha-tubulin suppressor-like RCC1 family protein
VKFYCGSTRHEVIVTTDDRVWTKTPHESAYELLPEIQAARWVQLDRNQVRHAVTIVGSDKIVMLLNEDEDQYCKLITNTAHISPNSSIVGVTYESSNEFMWNDLGEVFERQLKIDYPNYSNEPFTKLDNLPPIMSVSSGYSHTLFLDHQGCVWALDDNSSGQCGLLDQAFVGLPTQIPNLPTISQIIAGNYHSILIDTDHQVWGFGNNIYHQVAPLIVDKFNRSVCPINVMAASADCVWAPTLIPELYCHGSQVVKKPMIKSAFAVS